MRPLLRIAIRNLIQARRRTLLIAVALASVSLLLTLLTGLSHGLSEKMQEVATTLMAGHINVAGWYKPRVTEANPIIVGEPPVRELIEKNTPGLDYLIDRHRGYGRFSSGTASLQAMLIGLDVTQEDRLFKVLRLAEEREYKDGGRAEVFGDPRRLAEPRSVMLFVNHAKRLGVGVGDVVTLSNETFAGSRNAADLTVVAIAKDVGLLSKLNIFVGKQLIYDLYQVREDSTGANLIYLKDPEDAPRVMNHLRDVFEKAGYKLVAYDPLPFFLKFENISGEDWLGQKLDLTVWRDEVAFLGWILTALDTISIFFTAVLMVIIIIGIMNSMWISVRERTQEVGTLRAIGMSRLRVLVMFLLEALLLGLIASAIGSLAGAVLSQVINSANVTIPNEGLRTLLMSETFHFSILPLNILLVVFGFTMVTGASALWPASRAAKLEPVTALNKVG